MIAGMFNLFNIMGSEWVMWLLMALSVVSIGIIFERFRNLRNQERVGNLLWKEQIESLMKDGKMSVQKNDLSTKYPCLEAKLFEVLMTAKETNSNDLSLLMVSFLGKRKFELDKNLGFLGTLGTNTPFIGLFGTVLGIIKAFHDIGDAAAEKTAGAASISAGLSEALVATAVGLLVAIPAIMAFNFFQRKIKLILGRAESLGNYVISLKTSSTQKVA
jgi:biopolymer transport protein ExbB/TolQ